MKRLLTTLVVLTGLFGGAGVSAGAEPIKGFCLTGTKHSHLPIAGKCSASYEKGDYGTALREFQPLAEQGGASAQLNLGQMYLRGQGVPQVYKTAVKWYRLAAEQGNATGQNNLGVMYAKGNGVTQDYAEAVKWYRKSAEQGHAHGQGNLGWMYEKGKGVTQDYAEAVKWWRKAAEQGQPQPWKYRAHSRLGIAYANGQGVPQDHKTAAKLFMLADKQGDPEAQGFIEQLYKALGGSVSRGVAAFKTKDYATALREWEPVAELGDATAALNLGMLYANGYGVPKNYETSLKWYTVAKDFVRGRVGLNFRQDVAKRIDGVRAKVSEMDDLHTKMGMRLDHEKPFTLQYYPMIKNTDADQCYVPLRFTNNTGLVIKQLHLSGYFLDEDGDDVTGGIYFLVEPPEKLRPGKSLPYIILVEEHCSLGENFVIRSLVIHDAWLKTNNSRRNFFLNEMVDFSWGFYSHDNPLSSSIRLVIEDEYIPFEMFRKWACKFWQWCNTDLQKSVYESSKQSDPSPIISFSINPEHDF